MNEILAFINNYLPYLLAGLTGGFVSFIELATRFSDNFKQLKKNPASKLYVLVNFLISIFANSLVVLFDVQIAGYKITDSPYVWAVFIGLSSMAIIRSSLLNIKFKYGDVPVSTIEKLLKWIEIYYDRNKSAMLLEMVPPIVQDISLDIMAGIIPDCMATLSVIKTEDTADLNAVVRELKKDSIMDEKSKVRQLAFRLVKITGIEILEKGVEIYKKDSTYIPDKKLIALQEMIDLSLTKFGGQKDGH
jgi:hypothetical protein